MKTKNRKNLFFIMVAFISLVAITVTSVTLAWFKPSLESKVDQTIVVRKFDASLGEEGGEYSEAHSIDIKEAFPIADSIIETAKPVKNTYKFLVTNTGTINLMYRFEIYTVDHSYVGDTNKLSKQLKYSYRFNKNAEIESTATWSLPQLLIGESGNISLNKALQTLLVTPAGSYTNSGHLKAKNGNVEERGYFEICIWLQQEATQSSTTYHNASNEIVGKSSTITLTLKSQQTYAGAVW